MRTRPVLVAMVLWVGACGGEATTSAPVDCSFTACGGDLVGTWQFDSYCGDLIAAASSGFEDPECANVIRGVSTSETDVILTVQADGTYSQTGTVRLALSIGVTPACMSALAGESIALSGAICDSFGQGMDQSPESSSASCVYSGGVCVCTAVLENDVTGTGTYEVAGGTVTITSPDGVEVEQFCVQGGELRTSDSNGMVSIATRL